MPEATVFQVAVFGALLLAVCCALAVLARRIPRRKEPEPETDVSIARAGLDDALISRLRCLSAAERSEADAMAWRGEAVMYADRIERLSYYLKAREAEAVAPPAVPVAPMPESFAAQLGEQSMAHRQQGERDETQAAN